ncbi:unnamed protein product [Linum tenue]|uniref:Uncharacterized protein n=1 Tax=Linum tenue TaxID=586396 RepID=A0AAV0NW36_9ROSI|nr:unnamed protein product [Linum tenue]
MHQLNLLLLPNCHGCFMLAVFHILFCFSRW